MSAKIRDFGNGLWAFWCPGCKYGHAFDIARWTWNESVEKPTFHPSLMVNASVPGQRCHSIVTDGRIKFSDDCDHALKGQTIDLPDWEEATPAP